MKQRIRKRAKGANFSSYLKSHPPKTQVSSSDTNEIILFHGCAESRVQFILREGFDERVSNSDGRFGAGIYFAEDSSKSNQYIPCPWCGKGSVTIPQPCSCLPNGMERVYKILVVYVVMGDAEVVKVDQNFDEKYRIRRPRLKEGSEVERFDSIMGESKAFGGSHLNFREYVVYDRRQVYPAYVVSYKRRKQRKPVVQPIIDLRSELMESQGEAKEILKGRHAFLWDAKEIDTAHERFAKDLFPRQSNVFELQEDRNLQCAQVSVLPLFDTTANETRGDDGDIVDADFSESPVLSHDHSSDLEGSIGLGTYTGICASGYNKDAVLLEIKDVVGNSFTGTWDCVGQGGAQVSGKVQSSTVEFETTARIWGEINVPTFFSGTLNADGREISGTWNIQKRGGVVSGQTFDVGKPAEEDSEERENASQEKAAFYYERLLKYWELQNGDKSKIYAACFIPEGWRRAFALAYPNNVARYEFYRQVVQMGTSEALKTGSFKNSRGEELNLDLEAIDQSIRKTKVFDALTMYMPPPEPDHPVQNSTLHFVNGDALKTALFLKDTKELNPAILVMADLQDPKFYCCAKGQCGQFTNICRRSSLMSNLKRSNNVSFPMSQFKGVYCPDVQVFRDSEELGYPFLECSKSMSMICASSIKNPKLVDHKKRHKHKLDLSEKDRGDTRLIIEMILSIAQNEGHDSLVLGAFGCGYNQNPPEAIAEIFHDVIMHEFSKTFKSITFAIIDDENCGKSHNPEGNVKPFSALVSSSKKCVVM